MNSPRFSRREFLVASAAAARLPAAARAAAPPKSSPSAWPIGCFNRPWTRWSFDETLDAIKAAGYKTTGLLSSTKTDPFNGASATPEYLAALKQKIAARGLRANMTALRVPTNLELAAAIADVRQQLEHGRIVGVESALTFGVDRPDHYEKYFKNNKT